MDRVHLPLEVWQCILNVSDFHSQHRLRQVCKLFYYNLFIYDLESLPYDYAEKLNNNILQQHPRLERLYAWSNSAISEINHLTRLTYLDMGEYPCKISDEQLIGLPLLELIVSHNYNVNMINHLTQLTKLVAYGDCLLDVDLSGMKLLDLGISLNPYVSEIGHLTTLTCLQATSDSDFGNCTFVESDLRPLNLLELNMSYNKYISTITFLTNLTTLDISGDISKLTNSSLYGLSLLNLNVNHNPHITDIRHLTRLQRLTACYANCGISDASITNTDGTLMSKDLKVLHYFGNEKITVKSDNIK